MNANRRRLSAIVTAAVLAGGSLAAAVQSIGPSGNWGLDRIDQRSGTDGAFRYDADGRGVNIYIIDTGVRTTHDEFEDADGKSRAIYVGDFCNATAAGGAPRAASEETYDDGYDGHGTHNASYAAGRLSGPAKGARIYSLRAQGSDGPDCGENRNARAMTWAVKWVTKQGRAPGVVNISFGGGDAEVQRAILESIAAGFTYTLSAGTSGAIEKRWGSVVPARALVVAGTDRNDRALAAEPYGPLLAMFAPAKGLVGAGRQSDAGFSIPESCCGNNAGDSFAAPLAAGVAAVFLQRHPDATPAQVRAALIERATPNAVQGAGSSPDRLLYSGDPASSAR